jgi:hypothetical protein
MLTYADEFVESQVYVMQAEHSVSVFVSVRVRVRVCGCGRGRVCVHARDLVMALSGAYAAANNYKINRLYYIYYIIYI